ncbi:hypothetical protein G4B88_011056 [Cannabis sativa]|uniref:Uncharacterized protein n=1 Tax=Cannabis sativa TaxID=3483 RepID=A0A7J6EFI6_CANSA|nr:hypothetical protein G4B88_011056 [Cannabis sativa]
MSHGSSRTRRSLNYQVEEDAEMIFKEVGMDECENIADKEVEDLTEAEFEGIAEAECEMAEVELVQPRKMTNTSKNAQYDLYDDWQKKMCFEMMASLWRSGKSRLVKELNDAKNESERLAMKPDCIKSDAEWRSFVTQKTSKEHMAIRAKFQERRKKVVPHTLSRRGYARTIDDMKKDTKEGKVSRIEAFRRAHTKKNGEPINPTASEGELDNIIREDPNSEITENIEEDALTKLFGDPKSGRLIGQGRGITRSKLNGGKATPSEGQSLNATQSNNNPSPNNIRLDFAASMLMLQVKCEWAFNFEGILW